MLLKPPAANAKGFPALLDRMFDGLRRAYQRRLHKTLNFRALTVLILVGVLGLTAVMFMSTPKELAPEEDQGAIFTLIKSPQYANLDYLEKATAQVQAAADKIPEKDHVFLINGSAGVHQGFGGLILKNWADRKRNQKADHHRFAAEAVGGDRRADHRLFAARAARLDRRTAGPVRGAQHRRL